MEDAYDVRLAIANLFYLRFCYQPDCIHPICRAEKPQERLWYSNGSRLEILPGHMAIRLVKNAKVSGKSWQRMAMLSSSQVIADAFKQHKGMPSKAEVSELEAQVFLHLDEVQMWLKHL